MYPLPSRIYVRCATAKALKLFSFSHPLKCLKILAHGPGSYANDSAWRIVNKRCSCQVASESQIACLHIFCAHISLENAVTIHITFPFATCEIP